MAGRRGFFVVAFPRALRRMRFLLARSIAQRLFAPASQGQCTCTNVIDQALIPPNFLAPDRRTHIGQTTKNSEKNISISFRASDFEPSLMPDGIFLLVLAEGRSCWIMERLWSLWRICKFWLEDSVGQHHV